MSVSIPQIKLNTGASIPAVGLGTWKSAPGEVASAVTHALKSGYRHLDCAWIYGNEPEVGQGIKDSGVPREEIFITSKLWCTYHTRAEENIDMTLKALGTDYVDLYLIHWPIPMNPKGNDPKFPTTEDGGRDIMYEHSVEQKTWKAMEAIQKSGKAKAIGVSNFSIKKLERLMETAEITPAANQVELHPYLNQQDLVDWCHGKGIAVEAYSPLGSTDSPLLKEETVTKIASKHGVESGSVLIAYQVTRGVIVLPKSVTPARIEKNFKLIKLDDEDMKALNAMNQNKRFVKPDWGKQLKMEFPDWD